LSKLFSFSPQPRQPSSLFFLRRAAPSFRAPDGDHFLSKVFSLAVSSFLLSFPALRYRYQAVTFHIGLPRPKLPERLFKYAPGPHEKTSLCFTARPSPLPNPKGSSSFRRALPLVSISPPTMHRNYNSFLAKFYLGVKDPSSRNLHGATPQHDDPVFPPRLPPGFSFPTKPPGPTSFTARLIPPQNPDPPQLLFLSHPSLPETFLASQAKGLQEC